MRKETIQRSLFLMIIFFVFTFNISKAQITNVFKLVDDNGTNTPGSSQGPLGYYYWNGIDTAYMPGNAAQCSVINLGTGPFNLDLLQSAGFLLPLVIPSGVTLQGNYDLLGVANSAGATGVSGTLITSTLRNPYRRGYSTSACSSYVCLGRIEKFYLIEMEPGISSACQTTFRNIRLQGASLNWQDDNDASYITNNTDHLLCGGIFCEHSLVDINNPCSGCIGNWYQILNSEIFGFSHAGIWSQDGVDNITVKNCYLHHVKGSESRGAYNPVGIGYDIWTESSDVDTKIDIDNCIFDDSKEILDGGAGAQEWNFEGNTCSQFFYGGIGKHAGDTYIPPRADANCNITAPGKGIPYHCSATNGCQYYWDPTCSNAYDVVDCATANDFSVYQVAGGNINLTHNISHVGGLGGTPFPYFDNFRIESINPGLIQPGGATVIALNNNNISAGNLDNGAWQISNFGFNFRFFNNTYASCWVCTNGFIQFGTSCDFTVTASSAINTITAPNNYIALCFEDLDLTSASLKYWTTANTLVIEYDNAELKNTTETITGQIVIYENGGADLIIDQCNMHTSFQGVLGAENEWGTAGITTAIRNHHNWGVLTSPEAWHIFPPKYYFIKLYDNTDVADHANPGVYQNNHGGYATVADNYIEDCPWNNDPQAHIDVTSPNGANSFSYKSGVAVSNLASPQPPEVLLDLTDGSGVSLSSTLNKSVTPGHDNIQYAGAGTDIKVFTNAGSLGSQNELYIIRPNPDLGAATGNNNSGNNYYDMQKETVTGSSHSINSGNGYSTGGLHGIDVLAVSTDASANPYWDQYHSSAWQHIPVIVPTPDYHLVFNIKDSYQQFHNSLTGCSSNTGIKKEVRLNNTHVIWSEDIAAGGDGWELVDLDLASLNLLQYINTDGSPNKFSFDIAIENTVANSADVKGVYVWVDGDFRQTDPLVSLQIDPL